MSHPAHTLLDLLRQTRPEEMDCDTFARLLPALVDGNIDPASAIRERIEHHRSICPECDEELQLLRAVLSCLES